MYRSNMSISGIHLRLPKRYELYISAVGVRVQMADINKILKRGCPPEQNEAVWREVIIKTDVPSVHVSRRLFQSPVGVDIEVLLDPGSCSPSSSTCPLRLKHFVKQVSFSIRRAAHLRHVIYNNDVSLGPYGSSNQ